MPEVWLYPWHGHISVSLICLDALLLPFVVETPYPVSGSLSERITPYVVVHLLCS